MASDKRFYGYNPTLWGQDIIAFGLIGEYLPSVVAAGY